MTVPTKPKHQIQRNKASFLTPALADRTGAQIHRGYYALRHHSCLVQKHDASCLAAVGRAAPCSHQRATVQPTLGVAADAYLAHPNATHFRKRAESPSSLGQPYPQPVTVDKLMNSTL